MFSLRKKKQKPPEVAAVIVAAGSASRMAGIDKQQAVIDEIPVVVRSIAQFDACPMVTEIVIVCREEAIADYYALVQDYQLNKVASVVKGGAQRQDSVFLGIEACSEDAAFFAVHDGARPLIGGWEIEQCILAAMEHGAAAVGVPVKDTIKLCDGGFIQSTPDRSRLFAIQTPQIFEAGLYRRAMEQARRERAVYTDDCQLVERCGGKVFVSPGSYENMKITTPEDLALAQAILTYREEGPEQWQAFE